MVAFRLVYVLIILNVLTLVVRSFLLEFLNHQIIQFLGVVFPIILLIQGAVEINAFEQIGILFSYPLAQSSSLK